jgi:hypothetical protein
MKTLKHLMAVYPKKKIEAFKNPCELTVIDGKAIFIIFGANFPVDCKTKGTCKAIFSFIHFFEIVNSLKKPETVITITEDTLQVNGLVKINAKTTFFEDDKILRSILLPANFTDKDLLRISVDKKFTKEELEFNMLTTPIEESKSNYEKKVSAAHRILSIYGITKKDIRELINKRVYAV